VKKYLLTIQVPFETHDDPQARMIAKRLLQEQNPFENDDIKLQEIYSDKPPRKVTL